MDTSTQYCATLDIKSKWILTRILTGYNLANLACIGVHPGHCLMFQKLFSTSTLLNLRTYFIVHQYTGH